MPPILPSTTGRGKNVVETLVLGNAFVGCIELKEFGGS